MKIRLTIDLDPDTLALDLQSFLASVRFILRGLFPSSKMSVSLEPERKGTPCSQATIESTPPPPN